jgi:hypothetical protein
MIKYNQNSLVGNMDKCKKKPIMIYCKRISQPFRVESLEGDMQGKAGDYLMKGVDGELYICDKKIFEKSYDIIS